MSEIMLSLRAVNVTLKELVPVERRPKLRAKSKKATDEWMAECRKVAGEFLIDAVKTGNQTVTAETLKRLPNIGKNTISNIMEYLATHHLALPAQTLARYDKVCAF
jgi:Fic family protein